MERFGELPTLSLVLLDIQKHHPSFFCQLWNASWPIGLKCDIRLLSDWAAAK